MINKTIKLIDKSMAADYISNFDTLNFMIHWTLKSTQLFDCSYNSRYPPHGYGLTPAQPNLIRSTALLMVLIKSNPAVQVEMQPTTLLWVFKGNPTEM